MGKIIQNGIEYSGTYSNATSVNYDGSVSGLSAKTVQEAVDELSVDLGKDENGMTLHEKLDLLLGDGTNNDNPKKVRLVFVSSKTSTSVALSLYVDDVQVFTQSAVYNSLNVDETFDV